MCKPWQLHRQVALYPIPGCTRSPPLVSPRHADTLIGSTVLHGGHAAHLTGRNQSTNWRSSLKLECSE